MKKKTLALLLACCLTIGVAAGGTLAWLTDSTGEVKNTFTTSDIGVTLTETTGNSYKMIPGYEIEKDPKATVTAGSEECWLFVKVEKSTNFDTYMTYTMADGWTKLDNVDNVDNVYYRKVAAAEGTTVIATDTSFNVLKDDKVTVKDTVTKADMTTAKENNPTLTFTAYVCQLNKNATEEFSAAEAWNNAKPVASTTT